MQKTCFYALTQWGHLYVGPDRALCQSAVQSPGSPFGTPKPGSGRIIIVRTGNAEGSMEGLLLGVRDDPLSTLGRVQGAKAAELLMDVKVRRLTPR